MGKLCHIWAHTSIRIFMTAWWNVTHISIVNKKHDFLTFEYIRYYIYLALSLRHRSPVFNITVGFREKDHEKLVHQLYQYQRKWLRKGLVVKRKGALHDAAPGIYISITIHQFFSRKLIFFYYSMIFPDFCMIIEMLLKVWKRKLHEISEITVNRIKKINYIYLCIYHGSERSFILVWLWSFSVYLP